jgi:hypothetical protein
MQNTLIILIILFIACRLFSLRYVNHDDHLVTCDKPLPDIGFKLTPDLRSYDKKIQILYEIISVIPIGILLYNIYHTKDYNILQAFFIVYFILLLLKCTFYSMTILPDPSNECKYESSLTLSNLFGNLFTGRCKDLMFSGHFTLVYLSWAFIQHFYWNKSNNAVWTAIPYAHIATLVYMMLGLRRHYTIDVVVAFVITNYLMTFPITSFTII